MTATANGKPIVKKLVWKAVCDKIIIKPIDPPKETAGGIILPEAAVKNVMNKTRRAVVISVGPDVKTAIKRGDQILYNVYAGNEYEDGTDGEKILVIAEKELHGVAGEE